MADDTPRDWPIVYQDHMLVIAAGPLGEPTIGVSRRIQAEPMLRLSVPEARELAQALDWVLAEWAARIGRESFYVEPPKPRKPYTRKVKPEAGEEQSSDGE